MSCDEEKYQSEDPYNKLVLELIYEDSNNSFKLLRDDINSVNTRLTLLIGFNATLASLLPRLPIQSFLFLDCQFCHETDKLYPHAGLLTRLLITVINYLLSIKPLISLLLGTSIFFAIWGILPSATPMFIFPRKMLEKARENSEEDFRVGVIENRDETITRLQRLIGRKALRLKCALVTLGCAALFTVIDILINSIIQIN